MFDIDKALAGEPVRLRNGNKAYVKSKPIYDKIHNNVYYLGSYIDDNSLACMAIWNSDGNCTLKDHHHLDIVSMYNLPKEEPIKSKGTSMFNFKVGDKVYYPAISTKIFTLKENAQKSYPLLIENEDTCESFTENGLVNKFKSISSIFPATEEYKLLLDKLYDTKFEEPVDPIQELLNQYESVLCIVGNEPISRKLIKNINNLPSSYTLTTVTKYDSESNLYFSEKDGYFKYALPVSVNIGGYFSFTVFS